MRRDLQQNPAFRDEELDDAPEPPHLRFLRRLVTLLMATMIVGISVVAGTLVYRISQSQAPSGAALLAEIRIEPGMQVVETVFRTPDRIALLLRDEVGRETLRVYRLREGAAVEIVGE